MPSPPNTPPPPPPPPPRVRWSAPLWALTAFAPLVLANIVQNLTLFFALVSRGLYHRVNLAVVTPVWSWWSVIIERLHGIPLVATGDALPPGESAVVIANHQSMADIVVLLCLARRTRRMGDMRWMVKGSMRFVPFVGWAMLGLDFLFLKRDWSKDRAHIAAAFARFRAKTSPVWLVLFPEGTRKTPAKHAASQAHARRLGRALTPHVMLPRTKGFVASVQGLAGKIDAVYAITIIYPGGAPSLYALFSGGVGAVYFRVRRHPLASLPTDEAALAEWLLGAFQTMNADLVAQRS